MTDQLSIDYAFARPAPPAIHAAGYMGVWRYLSTDASKNLSKTEAAGLHAAGLGIGCVWETTATRALGGEAAGAEDGVASAAQATAVGLPHGCPLLVNIGDFAATPSELGVIHSYYFGWRQATKPWQTGGYGTRYLIDSLFARGARGLFWQNAMDDQGVKGNTISPHAGLYQRIAHTRPLIAGSKPGDYDENITVNGAAINFWMPAVVKPPSVITDGILESKTMHWTGHRMKSSDGGKTWTAVNP